MLLGGMLKCAEYGYRMIFELVDTHSSNVERELTSALGALHPDGVILTPPHGDNPTITNLLNERRIPFARIGSTGKARASELRWMMQRPPLLRPRSSPVLVIAESASSPAASNMR
jgi:DNA-binding LacI/PurR family transcriptional regulator